MTHLTTPISRLKISRFTGGLVVAIFLGLISLASVSHALLVNPTTPAPGGLTGLPLTTSTRTEQKLGSLVLGYQGSSSPTKLCLNTWSSTDAANCIDSWSDITTMATANFVQLHGNTPGALLSNYDAPQLGYVSVRGTDAAVTPTSFSTSIDPAVSPSTALFADGLDLDNYAGYFVGKMTIQGNGQLCLNGTAAAGDSSGHYCISHWSDISVPPLTDKLALQSPASAPNPQSGYVGLYQAFQSGSVVLGDPNALPASLSGYTCGDGMCSHKELALATCPLDCATISPLAAFTATDTGQSSVNLAMTTSTQSGATQVYVLVVRSTDPNFTFVPTNGQQYALGGSNAFYVVVSQMANQSSVVSVNDVNLAVGQTYYYHAYQANAYPRFTPVSGISYRTANATPTSSSGGGGDTGGDDDGNPILPPR